MSKTTGYWGIFLITLIVAAGGCASTKMPTTSGFLDNYSKMEPSAEIKGLWVEKHSYKSIGDYSKFMVDPVVVYFIPEKFTDKVNPKRVGVNAKKLAELTEYFREEIIKALEGHNYPIVDKAGEGVLRLRIAVTDVNANLPILNVYGYQTVTGIGLGSASMEGEAIDSMTNERIFSSNR